MLSCVELLKRVEIHSFTFREYDHDTPLCDTPHLKPLCDTPDEIILWDQTIIYVTEMSSKMALTLSQNWFTNFLLKKSKILFISYHKILYKFQQHVVQILTK